MDSLVRSYLSEFEMEARSVTSNAIALLRVRTFTTGGAEVRVVLR